MPMYARTAFFFGALALAGYLLTRPTKKRRQRTRKLTVDTREEQGETEPIYQGQAGSQEQSPTRADRELELASADTRVPTPPIVRPVESASPNRARRQQPEITRAREREHNVELSGPPSCREWLASVENPADDEEAGLPPHLESQTEGVAEVVPPETKGSPVHAMQIVNGRTRTLPLPGPFGESVLRQGMPEQETEDFQNGDSSHSENALRTQKPDERGHADRGRAKETAWDDKFFADLLLGEAGEGAGQQDRAEGGAGGAGKAAANDGGKAWGDDFFMKLLEGDGGEAPGASPKPIPGGLVAHPTPSKTTPPRLADKSHKASETLSTAFYSPAKPYPKIIGEHSFLGVATGKSRIQIKQGVLGVKIKDVVSKGRNRVQVIAVLAGGLVWRQGDVKAGDTIERLNGTTISDSDHLNDLIASSARDGSDLVLTYEPAPVPFAFFAGPAKLVSVTLYRHCSDVSPVTVCSGTPPNSIVRFDGSGNYSSPSPSTSTGRSPALTHDDTMSPQAVVLSTDSEAGSGSAIEASELTDVCGHPIACGKDLSDARHAWWGEYELANGRKVDLSTRRAVHWYFRSENAWRPYPDAESDALEAACEEGCDTVEFGDAYALMLTERKQVHLASNTRCDVLRATWHYQTSRGSFAPFDEATACCLSDVFASQPGGSSGESATVLPHDAGATAPGAVMVDIGKGRRIRKLPCGIVVQISKGSSVRLVLDGRPGVAGVLAAEGMVGEGFAEGFQRANSFIADSISSMTTNMSQVSLASMVVEGGEGGEGGAWGG